MTRHLRWSAIALVVALAAGACTGKPLPRPSFKADQYLAAGDLARVAELPAGSLPGWAAPSDERSDRIDFRLMITCGAVLPTDQQMPVFNLHQWSDPSGLPEIEQSIAAYAAPVAVTAVGEASKAHRCRSYHGVSSGTYRPDGSLDLPAAPAGSAQIGFCETESGEHTISVCTIVVGAGSLACAVRLFAADRPAAVALATGLLPAIRQACLRPPTNS